MGTPQKKQLNINIQSRPLASANDANSITIRQNNLVDIVFYQIVSEEEKSDSIILNMSGTSAVRMTLDQLKEFKDSIDKTISQHENKKTKK